MPQYVEESKVLEVPPASGIPGLLRTVEGILERPRVQEVVITPGKVSYKRFRREDEQELPLDVSLDTVMPAAIIRNSQLEELRLVSDNAAVVVSQLFAKAHMDGMNPIAFVGGPGGLFFAWHTKTTNVVLSKEECYGIPFLSSTDFPNEALILCTGYNRRAQLPDTVRAYKITIPLLKKTAIP
jgi:hypothetical protein